MLKKPFSTKEFNHFFLLKTQRECRKPDFVAHEMGRMPDTLFYGNKQPDLRQQKLDELNALQAKPSQAPALKK